MYFHCGPKIKYTICTSGKFAVIKTTTPATNQPMKLSKSGKLEIPFAHGNGNGNGNGEGEGEGEDKGEGEEYKGMPYCSVVFFSIRVHLTHSLFVLFSFVFHHSLCKILMSTLMSPGNFNACKLLKGRMNTLQGLVLCD